MFIKLRVHASARKTEIARKASDLYEIWVRVPAERGEANAACLKLLASSLGVPAGSIRLVKGGKSPSKIVEVLSFEG